MGKSALVLGLFEIISPLYKIIMIIILIRGGTFGLQLEYGAEKKVSQYSTVSATMTVGIPMGVSLKMR